VLASLAAHPNAGGVLIIGLGCESNQLDQLLAEAKDIDMTRVRAFTAQSADDEVEQGVQALEELVAVVEQDEREPCPLSSLTVGLKCGGSDGLSGITANPLVGYVADRVSEAGGTPILTEIPEVFGAEHLLMERATSEEVFRGIVTLVNDFKRYFIDNGQPIYENPSPGNIAGASPPSKRNPSVPSRKAGMRPSAQCFATASVPLGRDSHCSKHRVTMQCHPPRSWQPAQPCFSSPRAAARRWASRFPR
jgi:altronate hydrolase